MASDKFYADGAREWIAMIRRAVHFFASGKRNGSKGEDHCCTERILSEVEDSGVFRDGRGERGLANRGK